MSKEFEGKKVSFILGKKWSCIYGNPYYSFWVFIEGEPIWYSGIFCGYEGDYLNKANKLGINTGKILHYLIYCKTKKELKSLYAR
jgi:hypothetical protein